MMTAITSRSISTFGVGRRGVTVWAGATMSRCPNGQNPRRTLARGYGRQHTRSRLLAKDFERVHRGEIDTWDYQWVFANWVEGRMSILPAVNMISNIGFDKNATHTTGASDLANLARNPIAFPLTHPLGVIRNILATSSASISVFEYL